MRKRYLALLVILGLTLLPLSAAIVATYTSSPSLSFTTGTMPFASTDFVAHLGTLTITATAGETLYQPSLVNLNISEIFEFSGPVTWYKLWQTGEPVYNTETTDFYLAAVTTEFGVQKYTKLWGSGGTVPLTASKNALGVSVFEVKFYFLGHHEASKYKPGALYTMTSGVIGSFNVAVAPNNEGIYAHQENNLDIPVNVPPGGGPPAEPPVFIPSGTPSLPYEDPEHPVNIVSYAFSIIGEHNFTLPDGYGTNSVPIAIANLLLSNTTAGGEYGVEIQFTNLSNTPPFILRPHDKPSGYAIPYQLKFLNQTVIPGTTLEWENLTGGINNQHILITGISPSVAGSAPSGLYKDTIVVTITPIE